MKATVSKRENDSDTTNKKGGPPCTATTEESPRKTKREKNKTRGMTQWKPNRKRNVMSTHKCNAKSPKS